MISLIVYLIFSFAILIQCGLGLLYLSKIRRVGDELWNRDALGRAWHRFHNATLDDWYNFWTMQVNIWKSSVWRKLNPSLYIGEER